LSLAAIFPTAVNQIGLASMAASILQSAG